MKSLDFLHEPLYYRPYYQMNTQYYNRLEETLQHFEGIAVADRLRNVKENVTKVERKENGLWHIKFDMEDGKLIFTSNKCFPFELEAATLVTVRFDPFRHWTMEDSRAERIEYEIKKGLEYEINHYPMPLSYKAAIINRYDDQYKMEVKFSLNVVVAVLDSIDIGIVNNLKNNFFPLVRKVLVKNIRNRFN